MSERTTAGFFDYEHVGGWVLGLVALAAGFVVAALVGACLDARQFAFSYLTAFVFFFTISMGALFWVMIHHIVDAEWSVGVRRQFENVSSLISVLGILFIPLVFVAPDLWAWMKPDAGHGLEAKEAYLNAPFFWARTAVYFFVFTALAWMLRSFSVAQDRDGASRHTIACRRTAFAGGVPYALCMTFAAIDWVMSLDWSWVSAIFGVYVFSGAILAGLCTVVVIVTALRATGYLREVVTVEHYHIMGKLMLGFTIFWAYIAFSQYLIIWYANIPEETAWFARWGTGAWRIFSMILILGHFVVPFLFLIPAAVKRSPRLLCGAAAWLVLMHLLDVRLMIMPILRPGDATPGVLDVIAFLAVALVLAVVFLKRLGDVPVYPLRDPRLDACKALTNE